MIDRSPEDWFAARRHLTGLSVTELAAHLAVNPRTVRSWESGRDPIPARIAEIADQLFWTPQLRVDATIRISGSPH